jgi:hypothetical protein
VNDKSSASDSVEALLIAMLTDVACAPYGPPKCSAHVRNIDQEDTGQSTIHFALSYYHREDRSKSGRKNQKRTQTFQSYLEKESIQQHTRIARL